MSVCVRVKPAPRDAMIAIWPKDAERGRTRRWVCCNRGYIMEEYEFSRIFGPEDANRNVYEELHGPALISSVFSGVNETLFAYGQTGSGKTHTIFGSGSETGLLQYFVREMFALSYRAAGSTIHACCYEIFGDTLTDLIEPEELIARGKLLDEDVVSDELFLKTQKCKYRIARVGSVETCVELLHKARINRACGVSSCNPYSSRSHAVVHLFVQNPSSEASDGGSGGSTSSSIGALTLVDLAGAEKEHDNPSEQGKSSARILNTSLSSLNRLLRKLQTNSLDESERRQSVLNKCLWEYLRPGCGISLIFCVSPLLKHRCTSLSTLSMATDSKTIHSRRKAQFINISPPPGPTSTPTTRPARGGANHRARTPMRSSDPVVQWNELTPPPARRQRSRTPDFAFPRNDKAPSLSAVVREALGGRTGSRIDLGDKQGVLTEPSILGDRRGSRMDLSSSPALADIDVDEVCGHVLQSPEAVKRLALQNAELRRTLNQTRARSQDRVSQLEEAKKKLSSENSYLRRECETLRSSFASHQRQQLEFWNGPFAELVLPSLQDGLSVKSASSSELRGRFQDEEFEMQASPVLAEVSQYRGRKSASEETLGSLKKERDYWRTIVSEMKQDSSLHLTNSSCKESGSDRSSHHGRDLSCTLVSDSGSELSARAAEIFVGRQPPPRVLEGPLQDERSPPDCVECS